MIDQAHAPGAPAAHAMPRKRRRGFINPTRVRTVAFCVISLCIIISVIACVLAIWDFAKQDALWRTVATCVMVASGFAVFGVVNVAFGAPEE